MNNCLCEDCRYKWKLECMEMRWPRLPYFYYSDDRHGEFLKDISLGYFIE